MNYFTDISSVREMLGKLAEAPDSQVDVKFRKELSHLATLDTLGSQDVKSALDMCVHSSLASDFVVKVLDIIYKQLKTWNE
ncbi:hypothetical protein PQC16_gp184 [Rhizobium phage RHph_TM30]|uniref:Uncharacterized protein n=1 Tax=Rhizobium phage RHph_TM30 TaxID=2509764 RepID=A0A7S5R533_9CAUD|nr:hypothetical protein PQC16_gp184 [Rhizobium phage RHph_TM30]QIG71291.1 hypothetical protein EVB93_184 [Rhizobium phage RHph_TM30]